MVILLCKFGRILHGISCWALCRKPALTISPAWTFASFSRFEGRVPHKITQKSWGRRRKIHSRKFHRFQWKWHSEIADLSVPCRGRTCLKTKLREGLGTIQENTCMDSHPTARFQGDCSSTQSVWKQGSETPPRKAQPSIRCKFLAVPGPKEDRQIVTSKADGQISLTFTGAIFEESGGRICTPPPPHLRNISFWAPLNMPSGRGRYRLSPV